MISKQSKITQEHVGVYGVVFDIDKGSVLLIHKGRGPYKGMYDLPGGTIEEGESEEDTLLREFEEEIGVSPATYTFLYKTVYQFDYESQTRGLIDFIHTGYFYIAELPHGATLKQGADGHDSLGAVFVSLKDIFDEKIVVAPMARSVIMSLL